MGKHQRIHISIGVVTCQRQIVASLVIVVKSGIHLKLVQLAVARKRESIVSKTSIWNDVFVALIVV
ncbi:hypothetical protein D3C85_1100120 [compost metagenome]